MLCWIAAHRTGVFLRAECESLRIEDDLRTGCAAHRASAQRSTKPRGGSTLQGSSQAKKKENEDKPKHKDKKKEQHTTSLVEALCLIVPDKGPA